MTLYFDSGCTTAKSSALSNSVFASPGITVSSNVPADTSTPIYAKAIDLAGNTSSCTLLTTYVNDSLGPTVQSVTSSTPNGTYKAGNTVAIRVTFSETVNVSGTPQITLETGASDAIVNYSSGSGTSTLTFVYTITDCP